MLIECCDTVVKLNALQSMLQIFADWANCEQSSTHNYAGINSVVALQLIALKYNKRMYMHYICMCACACVYIPLEHATQLSGILMLGWLLCNSPCCIRVACVACARYNWYFNGTTPKLDTSVVVWVEDAAFQLQQKSCGLRLLLM